MLPEEYKKNREAIIAKVQKVVVPYGGICGTDKDITERPFTVKYMGHYFPIYWKKPLDLTDYKKIVIQIWSASPTGGIDNSSTTQWWIRIPEFWC